MLVQQSGPHVVKHLQSRVDSLKAALDAAQARVADLERAFGSDAELIPLIKLGLSPSEARIVHLIRSRDHATAQQAMFAIYADNPDQMNEVDAYNNMKVFVSTARNKLSRFGISIDTLGWGAAATGYWMSGPDKARLTKLIASGARLVTRGRPDRKHYKQVSRGVGSAAMHG
jgi:hypothetical protein